MARSRSFRKTLHRVIAVQLASPGVPSAHEGLQMARQLGAQTAQVSGVAPGGNG